MAASTTTTFENFKYLGMYRDDGFDVVDKITSPFEIKRWHDDFQKIVRKITCSDFLVFTCELWDPDCIFCNFECDNLFNVRSAKKIPYLDMEMHWNENLLIFGVFTKKNQQIKYLNKGSSHTNATFKAIPQDVFKRLAKLTSITESNCDKNLEEIYPKRIGILRKANLCEKNIPSLKKLSIELKSTSSTEELAKKKHKEKQERS